MKSAIVRLGLVPLLLLLGGCGWEPLIPAPDAQDGTRPPENGITAKIVYECPNCVRPEGGAAPLSYTFRAEVTLSDPEEESVLIYTWDFGDGAKDEGERVTHTYEEPGTYTVKLRVITSSGREASDGVQLDVQPPPEPEPQMQRDVKEGELCTFERVLPRGIGVGDEFQVEVTITANQDVRYIIWEDNAWFPQFRLKQDPSGVWIEGMKAGAKKILVYDVELWQTPPPEIDLWMEGMLKCNRGGLGESEELILRSELDVVRP